LRVIRSEEVASAGPERSGAQNCSRSCAVGPDRPQCSALCQAEANLTALIESTDDHIWSVDLDLRLLTFNSALASQVEKSFGVCLERGTHFQDVVPPETARNWLIFYQNALRDGHFHMQAEIPGSRIFDFSLNTVLVDGKPTGISVIGRDVTSQQSALELQRLLASIVEHSDEAIHSVTLDGRIASWNRGAELLFGYAAEEIVGRTIIETLALPSRHEAVAGQLNEVKQGRGVGPVETVLRHKNGQLVDVSLSVSPIRDADGNICGASTYVRDVRKLRKAEDQLRDSEERYRASFEQAAIGISHAGFDGVILRCNARFTAMLGYGPEQIAGRTIASITAPEHIDVSSIMMQRVASGAAQSVCFEKLFLHSNGSRVWARVTVSAQRDGRGTPIHLISFIEDITARKTADEELAETRQALQVSEARYRLAFENTIDAININRLHDGLYVNCNLAFLGITGYSREEVIGHSSRDLNIWVDPSVRQRMVEEVLQFSVCRNFEAQFRKKNGELVWGQMSVSLIDIDGEPCVLSVTRDITAAKEAVLQLAAAADKIRISEERYSAVFRSSFDGIVIQDLNSGVIIDANPMFLSFMGYSREEVLGRTTIDLDLWADLEDRARWFHLLAQTDRCDNFEARFRKKNGELTWALLSASVVDIDGVPSLIVIARDISAAKTAEHEIRTLAFYDSLTGLPNRRLLLERLQQALSSGLRSGLCRALLFVDLDNFKTLNDTLGHQTGDRLLREVARRIANLVRESDTVARLGGDEFVVMLMDLDAIATTAAAQARTTAEKILAAVERPYLIDGRECLSACSIGITLFGNHKVSIDEILQQADIAMYEAKAAGRNTLHFFAPSLQAAVKARAALEKEMRQGLRNREFVLYFQPQIDHERLAAAECLLRWQHPRRGTVLPGEFIRIAEESGLILPLGNFVLETACAQIAAWGRSPETERLIVAVNISPVQLRQADFVDSVLAALKRAGANPARLNLELTESMLVDSMEEVITKMCILKQHGIHFSLDDFGTGYSSLAYLKRLPLDQLKIDRAFVRDLIDDTASSAIAQTIVSLGCAMGLSIIAEGVETAAQHDSLLRLGCHCFQGYHFGYPVPIAEFENRWLGSSALPLV